MFEVAVRHMLAQSRGWDLGVDPRWMVRIRTNFDVDRDFDEAPSPILTDEDEHLANRTAVLGSIGIRLERMEEYAACTRYLGGIPSDEPAVDPEAERREREGRHACADRADRAAAVFGRPVRSEEGHSTWSIRAYFLTPVSREIYDLILVPEAGGWRVAREITVMNIQS